MNDTTRTELEAAAFRALVHHLMEKRPDVQNIDLMNLGGFCRNCLSRWYQEAAAERGLILPGGAVLAFLAIAAILLFAPKIPNAVQPAALGEPRRTVITDAGRRTGSVGRSQCPRCRSQRRH